MFRECVPENRERSANYPATTQVILSLIKCLGSGWVLGATPKRAPILTLNGHATERPARFGQGMGWFAQKPNSRVGPGSRAMVWLSLTCIQNWRLPALHYAVRPSIPTASWQAFAAGKSSSNAATAKVHVLVLQPVDHGVDD